MTRAQVVAEARSWIGTPFRHQAYMKGVAADCVGLVGGVAMSVGAYGEDLIRSPQAAKYIGYSNQPDDVLMREACGTFFGDEIAFSEVKPADVILVRFDRGPQHLGIVTPYLYEGGKAFVHASSVHGRVIETRLLFGTGPKTMKFVAAYRIPGVE